MVNKAKTAAKLAASAAKKSVKNTVWAAVKYPATTIGGILQFLAVLTHELHLMYDGVDTTNPDWNLIIASAGVLIALLRATYGSPEDETQTPEGE